MTKASDRCELSGRDRIVAALAGMGALLLALPTPAAIIVDDLVSGSVLNTFQGLPPGNVAGFISQTGATYGERFAGQTLSTAGGFDSLVGVPSDPLTLLANPETADNIGLIIFRGSTRIYGDLDAQIGDGALSISLDLPTDVLGFEVLGADNGSFTTQFFAVDGALLGTITQPAASAFFGFRATAGEAIRGVSITNVDFGGIAFDNFTFNQVPEPAAALLLASGLGGLAWTHRRLRAERRRSSGSTAGAAAWRGSPRVRDAGAGGRAEGSRAAQRMRWKSTCEVNTIGRRASQPSSRGRLRPMPFHRNEVE